MVVSRSWMSVSNVLAGVGTASMRRKRKAKRMRKSTSINLIMQKSHCKSQLECGTSETFEQPSENECECVTKKDRFLYGQPICKSPVVRSQAAQLIKTKKRLRQQKSQLVVCCKQVEQQ